MPARRVKWSDAASDVVAHSYGAVTPKFVAALVLQHAGVRVTPKACMSKAARLGITARDNQGDLCLADAAAEIGVGYRPLADAARRLGYKLRRVGKYTFVPDEAIAKLREMYARPSEPTISADEAGKVIGVSGNAVKSAWRAGRLRGWRVGKKIRISAADADRFGFERRQAIRARVRRGADRDTRREPET